MNSVILDLLAKICAGIIIVGIGVISAVGLHSQLGTIVKYVVAGAGMAFLVSRLLTRTKHPGDLKTMDSLGDDIPSDD